MTQDDIDWLIEEVEPEYEGTLWYEPFVNLLTKIDPKLMESDKPLSPKVEEKPVEKPPKRISEPPNVETLMSQNAIVPNSNLTLQPDPWMMSLIQQLQRYFKQCEKNKRF